MKVQIAIVGLSAMFQLANVMPAAAHLMPWRDGESRVKGFGHCAKGPCMKRYDFSVGKPHHHHAGCIVVGSVTHSAYETCTPNRRHRT